MTTVPPAVEQAIRMQATRTVATWLKARRDEHTPGNYPHWLLSALLGELHDAIRDGHVPGTELERMAKETL